MKRTIRKLLRGCMAALLLFGLAACAPASAETNTADTEIMIGEAVTFATFDPLGAVVGQGFLHYYKMVYDGLVDYENGKPVPALAERWESDGNTWTFHLRKGVTFTDGAPFTADVVKLNFEGLQQNMMDMISYYGAISRISDIEVVDDYTVKLHYDAPYYAVLEELSGSVFGILSPNLFADGNLPYSTVTETAGTGPYAIRAGDYTDGVSYTFVRNAAYWGEKTGPDRFTVKIITDPDARMMALQSGEIDLLAGTYQMTFDMYDYLSGQEGIEAVQSEMVYATRNLLLNTARDHLSDLRVRKAIQHGINKEQIVDTILHGMETAADTLFPKTLPFCDVEQTVYGYDPAAAISLLEEAGWSEQGGDGIRIKDGQRLTLEAICMSERTIDGQILMAFKGQMAEIGIEVNVSPYENATWFEIGLAGEFDISVNDTYAFPQDPQVFVAAMLDYGLDNPAQQGLSQKPEIDAQIHNLLTTMDEGVIQDAYTYILTTLQSEAVNVPVSSMHEIAAYNAEKIQSVYFSVYFADDPATCYVNKIILK